MAGRVFAASGVAIELRGTARAWNWAGSAIALGSAGLLVVTPYLTFDAHIIATAPEVVALIVAVCRLGRPWDADSP